MQMINFINFTVNSRQKNLLSMEVKGRDDEKI